MQGSFSLKIKDSRVLTLIRCGAEGNQAGGGGVAVGEDAAAPVDHHGQGPIVRPGLCRVRAYVTVQYDIVRFYYDLPSILLFIMTLACNNHMTLITPSRALLYGCMFRLCARNCHSYIHLIPALGIV